MENKYIKLLIEKKILVIAIVILIALMLNEFRTYKDLTAHYNTGEIQMISKQRKGKKWGLTTNYYSNGNISMIVNYENDKKEGEGRWYYKNGDIMIIENFKNGELEGRYTAYNEDGSIQEDIFYKDDKITDKTSNYANEDETCQYTYINEEENEHKGECK
jgi:antitoxin component YwqK of YwqJK toxin-antitoxin module